MNRKLLYLLCLTATGLCFSQTCPSLIAPLNNAQNVTLNSTITWEPVADVRGYYIIAGTGIGLRDIADRVFVGTDNFYDPPTNLPDNTVIYVRITLAFSDDRPDMTCNIQRFSTGTPIPVPECTRLLSPRNGETGVPLLYPLEWERIADADAYRVRIGTSEGSNDFLDATFDTNSTPNLVFASDSEYFVTIIPINSGGDAVGCSTASFATLAVCEPFVDPDTGVLVTPRPVIDFPDEIAICLNDIPERVVSTDTADGFRWYRIDAGGMESLISETAEVRFSEEGIYRYEAYNTIGAFGTTVECAASKTFEVVASERALIDAVNITPERNQSRVAVQVSGIGDYEYALNDPNGPYQIGNSFDNLADGYYTVYVRDTKGCGTAEKAFVVIGYPKFFTPNADGRNDTWHLNGTTHLALRNGISIFDRYGNLIQMLLPDGPGWDGTSNGAPLPSSDYWFRTVLADGTTLKGHFTLKR